MRVSRPTRVILTGHAASRLRAWAHLPASPGITTLLANPRRLIDPSARNQPGSRLLPECGRIAEIGLLNLAWRERALPLPLAGEVDALGSPKDGMDRLRNPSP